MPVPTPDPFRCPGCRPAKRATGVPHTPGPWAVETCLDNRGARNGLYLIQTANTHQRGRTLAHIHRHFAGTYGETEANARLMAAAPKLLAALRVLLGTSECTCIAAACAEDCTHAIARRAIAEAEGQA